MSRVSRALLGATVVLALAGTTAQAQAQAHAQTQAQSRPGKSPTQRVSTGADGGQADGSSSEAAISADGRMSRSCPSRRASGARTSPHVCW